MIEWYLHLTLFDRAVLLLLFAAYGAVMYGSFRSLTSSHNHITWYRGIYSTPIFQLLMWLAVLPLIVPALLAFVRRKRALATAPFIGNLKTRVYHNRNCEYQARISSDFLRYPLWSAEQAEKFNFRRCNWEP